MAYSTQRAVSDGTLVTLPLSIDYFERSEISVFFNSLPAPTGWSWVGTTDKTITFSPAVPVGVEVLVRRATMLDRARNVFSLGAQFLARTLDENTTQVLRVAQEVREGAGVSEVFNDLNAHGYRLRNLGDATDAGDAITLRQYLKDLGGPAAAAASAAAAALAVSAANAAAATANAAAALASGAVNTFKSSLASPTGVALVGGAASLAQLAASTGTSLLRFTLGVAGSQIMDLQTKLRYQLDVSPEDFKLPEDTDDGPSIQRAVDYGLANSVNVTGKRKYVSAIPVTIRPYRTEPAVSLDFAVFNLTLNQLRYTGTTGRAIDTGSPTVRVYVKKLIGPGGDVGNTTGLYVTGQGDTQHKVDWVSGFTRNIHYDAAYSHTLWVGYCDDAQTGLLINGNAIKVVAGRIGGQFSFGTTATDATTCNIGIDMTGTANDITANVEYCKRTANSIGVRDGGQGNRFRGYVESCSAYNLYLFGTGGKYEVASGTNRGPAANFCDGDNSIYEVGQYTENQVVPDGSNTTLTYSTASTKYSYGFSSITGSEGYREMGIPSSPADAPVNEIAYSDTLNGPTWALSTIGSAVWGGAGAAYAADAGFIEAGYRNSTKFTFPAMAGASDIWVATQAGRTTRPGPVVYGAWLRVGAGEVEMSIRILNPDTNRQSRHVVRLRASNKWVNVQARFTQLTGLTANAQYDIQFRTTTGATVYIANTYIVNEPRTFFPPVNSATPPRKSIKCVAVDGNGFENGMTVNGAVRTQMSPAIAAGGAYLLGDYPVMLVTGGWEGNLFFPPSTVGVGHRFELVRDGVAAASATMQILPAGTTVNGSTVAISIAAPWTSMEFIWNGSGWVRLK